MASYSLDEHLYNFIEAFCKCFEGVGKWWMMYNNSYCSQFLAICRILQNAIAVNRQWSFHVYIYIKKKETTKIHRHSKHVKWHCIKYKQLWQRKMIKACGQIILLIIYYKTRRRTLIISMKLWRSLYTVGGWKWLSELCHITWLQKMINKCFITNSYSVAKAGGQFGVRL